MAKQDFRLTINICNDENEILETLVVTYPAETVEDAAQEIGNIVAARFEDDTGDWTDPPTSGTS